MSGWLRLHPALSPAALRAVFERFGRLHVPGVFAPASAKRVAAALAGAVPWSRSVLVNGNPYDIGLQAIQDMPPERRRELDDSVAAAARAGFQYQFDNWRLSDRMEAGEPIPAGPCADLADLYRFLNGPAFLDFIRAVTGETHAVYCDAQATRYRAGHFLTAHDDDVAGKNRRLAYVLNFTPEWRADWGGLLAFHDADGHLSEAYAPKFNALNLFAVPQLHSVTEVASYVTASRYAVTGWVRSARP